MNAALRGSAAHVFVDSLSSPDLSDDDEHHLRRVLRIRPSDLITVSDGAGSWVTARLVADGLSVESEPIVAAAPRAAVILSAIPKGDRLEWMVQKLTEVGATAIGFIDCARSVVHWDAERSQRQGERLRRVAREAAMQSRRLWMPELLGVVPVAVAAADIRSAMADLDGREVIDHDIDTVLVGPEGGFVAAELALAARRVSLSGNVLRVETAAVVAAIMLTLRHELA